MVSISILLPGKLSAQNNNLSDFERLADVKVGKWKWKIRGYAKAGDPTIYNGVGYSNHYYANDSLALIDDHRFEWENGMVYRAITYRTYDTLNNNFLVVWAQANTSNTSKIIGVWQGEEFLEKSSGTDQYGNWTDLLRLYDIEKNSHKAKLVRTYESGFKITILEYEATRLSDN